MNNVYIKNIIRFVLLVLFQVLVLDQVSFGGYVIPYVYVLFILLLPFDIPKSLMLFLAFGVGITIDAFGNTLGLHAAAMVFVAYVRPGILQLYFKKIETMPGEEPGIRKLGFSGFIKYSFTLILLHHLLLFYLEIFNFRHFFVTFEHVIINSIASLIGVIILVLLFTKRNRRKR